MLRRLAVSLGLTMLALLGMAKLVLRSRVEPHLDEIDVAVVAGRRRHRPLGDPFIGATVLVAGGRAELDLRRVEPAPTGVEVAVTLVGARLTLVVPPGWEVKPSFRGRWFSYRAGLTAPAEEPTRVWLHGRALLSLIDVIAGPIPNRVD